MLQQIPQKDSVLETYVQQADTKWSQFLHRQYSLSHLDRSSQAGWHCVAGCPFVSLTNAHYCVELLIRSRLT